MPKLKTHKGIKKRFKVSATGKVSHKRCGSSHLNSHKSGKQIRRLRKKSILKVEAEAHRLRRAVHANARGSAPALSSSPRLAAREGCPGGSEHAARRRCPRLNARSRRDLLIWFRSRRCVCRHLADELRVNDACKEGAARNKAKKRLFRAVEGFVGGRRRLLRSAKETLLRAGVFAFRDRRAKKRDVPQAVHHPPRRAAAEMRGLRYSRLIHGLHLAKIGLDRKSLSDLAIHDPEDFDAIVALVREQLASHDEEVGRGRRPRSRLPEREQSAMSSSSDPLAAALAELDALESAGLAALGAGVSRRPRSRPCGSSISGLKQGRLKTAQERLKTLEPAVRRVYGQRFNAVKQALEAARDAAKAPGRTPERRSRAGST